jgi:hypothetical protein
MNEEHWEHWEEPSSSLPDTYFTAYDRLKFPRRVAERLVSLTGLEKGGECGEIEGTGNRWIKQRAGACT